MTFLAAKVINHLKLLILPDGTKGILMGTCFLSTYHIYLVSIYTGKKESFQIEPGIVISIKEIEEYYRRITTNKHLKYEIDSRTLSVWLASIQAFPDGVVYGIGHKRFDWIIHTSEDVEPIGNMLIKNIREIAIPYIAKNANVPQVDKLLNENLNSTLIHCASYPDRIMRGLIAGKLVGRTNMDEITKYYDNIMSQTAPDLQSEYAALKELLPEIHQKYNSL